MNRLVIRSNNGLNRQLCQNQQKFVREPMSRRILALKDNPLVHLKASYNGVQQRAEQAQYSDNKSS